VPLTASSWRRHLVAASRRKQVRGAHGLRARCGLKRIVTLRETQGCQLHRTRASIHPPLLSSPCPPSLSSALVHHVGGPRRGPCDAGTGARAADCDILSRNRACYCGHSSKVLQHYGVPLRSVGATDGLCGHHWEARIRRFVAVLFRRRKGRVPSRNLPLPRPLPPLHRRGRKRKRNGSGRRAHEGWWYRSNIWVFVYSPTPDCGGLSVSVARCWGWRRVLEWHSKRRKRRCSVDRNIRHRLQLHLHTYMLVCWLWRWRIIILRWVWFFPVLCRSRATKYVHNWSPVSICGSHPNLGRRRGLRVFQRRLRIRRWRCRQQLRQRLTRVRRVRNLRIPLRRCHCVPRGILLLP
jgi:hypothetical protein